MGIEDDAAREDDCDSCCDVGNEDNTVGDIVLASVRMSVVDTLMTRMYCQYFGNK